MGHPLGSNLNLLFLSFTSLNKGSFSYISDKKPGSISIKETDYFLKIFGSREVAWIRHLHALSIPGVGHLQILRCPGTGHLPTPNFWHARGFLSEYNYTEDFTGKTGSSVKDRKKLKRFIKACFRFYACISSLLIKPELHSEIGSYRRKSKFFGLSNQISIDVIWRTSFHIYKTIHNS